MGISASDVMSLRQATGAGMMDCKKALEESGGDMEKAHDFLRKKGISVAAKKSGRETKEGGIGIVQSGDGASAAMVQLACETDFVSRNEQFKALLDQLSNQVIEAGDENVPEQPMVEGEGTVTDVLTKAVGTLGENIQFIEAAKVEVAGGGTVGGYVHTNGKIGVLVAMDSDGGDKGQLAALGKDLAMHIAASQVAAIDQDQIPQAELDKEKEIFEAQARESGKPDDIVEKMVAGRLKKYVKEISLMDQPFVKDPDKTIQAMLADAGKTLGAEVSVSKFVKFQF